MTTSPDAGSSPTTYRSTGAIGPARKITSCADTRAIPAKQSLKCFARCAANDSGARNGRRTNHDRRIVTAMSEREYVLGTSDDEIRRLGLQHRVWRPW